MYSFCPKLCKRMFQLYLRGKSGICTDPGSTRGLVSGITSGLTPPGMTPSGGLPGTASGLGGGRGCNGVRPVPAPCSCARRSATLLGLVGTGGGTRPGDPRSGIARPGGGGGGGGWTGADQGTGGMKGDRGTTGSGSGGLLAMSMPLGWRDWRCREELGEEGE